MWDAWVDANCGNGKLLMGAAVLSRTTARDPLKVRLSESLLGQKALPLKASEAQAIIQGVAAGDLHRGTFSLAGTEYLATSVVSSGYHARATGLGQAGGRFPGGAAITYDRNVVLLGVFGADAEGRAVLAVEDFLAQMLSR